MAAVILFSLDNYLNSTIQLLDIIESIIIYLCLCAYIHTPEIMETIESLIN
jgi:hypothetical protein